MTGSFSKVQQPLKQASTTAAYVVPGSSKGSKFLQTLIKYPDLQKENSNELAAQASMPGHTLQRPGILLLLVTGSLEHQRHMHIRLQEVRRELTIPIRVMCTLLES